MQEIFSLVPFFAIVKGLWYSLKNFHQGGDTVITALTKPNPVDMLIGRLVDTQKESTRFLPQAIRERVRKAIETTLGETFFIPLLDEEITLLLPQFIPLLKQWRLMATAHSYSGPVVWLVRAGFSLRRAPCIGPCLRGEEFSSDLDLYKVADDQTTSQVVFWIPVLLPGTINVVLPQKIAELEQVRNRWQLPPHHLNSPGKAELLLGLCIEYFHRTGQGLPQDPFSAVTSTLNDAGNHIITLGFDERGFRYGQWSPTFCPNPHHIGCFPVGEETLE